jgi:hydrogenase nickel incorporation protein HypA/HybF
MHEFSIASDIVRNVLDTAEQNKAAKILSIQLDIGELALLSIEQVAFWVEELLKDSIAEGAKVKVKKIKARVRCEACGHQGGIQSDAGDPFRHFAPLSCPRCGSSHLKIEKGRECFLRKIQVLK